MSNIHVSADRSRTLRSRVTNGKELLANVDGRTASARRYRDLTISLADDLGGTASLTEAQRALVRQAAAMIGFKPRFCPAGQCGDAHSLAAWIEGLELLSRRLDQTMTSRAARSRAFEERLQSDDFF